MRHDRRSPGALRPGMGSRRRGRRRDGGGARTGPRRHRLQQHGHHHRADAAARTLGADGALVVTPYYNQPTQEGLYRHFAAIAEAVDLPLVLYNVPGRTGVNLLPETVVRLADTPGIVGIKEASGSLDQASQIVREAPEAFVVVSGDDSLTLPMMGVGGRGVISVVSNIVPEAVSAMTSACLAGDFSSGRALHLALFDLCRAMFVETNPVPVKAAAALLGYCTPEVRLPLAPLSEASKETVRRAMVAVGLIN